MRISQSAGVVYSPASPAGRDLPVPHSRAAEVSVDASMRSAPGSRSAKHSRARRNAGLGLRARPSSPLRAVAVPRYGVANVYGRG